MLEKAMDNIRGIFFNFLRIFFTELKIFIALAMSLVPLCSKMQPGIVFH